MDEKQHTEFIGICRRIGWKCTSQRLAVYAFLQGNRLHPDVDTVLFSVRKTLPTVTRESIYRILNEFSEQGIISRLDHIDCARYDSRTAPHGHFICGRCGEISDFDWPEGAAVSPSGVPGSVRHVELRLVGVCKKCSIG